MGPPFLGLFIGGWFRVASKRSHPMRQRNSAQAGNVIGNPAYLLATGSHLVLRR